MNGGGRSHRRQIRCDGKDSGNKALHVTRPTPDQPIAGLAQGERVGVPPGFLGRDDIDMTRQDIAGARRVPDRGK